MDIYAQLRRLEFQYLVSASAARAAKAIYFASVPEVGPVPPAAKRTQALWQTLLAQKRAIAALMGDLEDTDTAG